MKFLRKFYIWSLMLFVPLLLGAKHGGCEFLEELFFNYYYYCNNVTYPSNVLASGQRQNKELVFISSHNIFYPEECIYNATVVSYTLNDMSDVASIYTSNIIVGDNGVLFKFFANNELSSLITTPAENNNLNRVYVHKCFEWPFEGSPFVYAVGDNGTIIKSTDWGNNWELINFPYSYDLKTISVKGCGDTILVAGSSYKIYKTTNGGETWEQISIGLNAQSQKSSGSNSFNKIYFYNDSIGFIGGPLGIIVKTTDGGNTWQTIFLPGFNEINDFFFISPDSGVAVGSPGVVRFTTDRGSTWFEDPDVTTYLNGRTITNIAALGKNYGFILGEGDVNSFVAKDSTYLDSLFNPTAVEDEQQVVTEYILSQNYPNPFNPSTRIKFEIPSASLVTLKIYDLLGNEITTLVDEEKTAGVYEVEFKADELTSGIYFYKLQAEGFTQTKKFIFLK